MFSTFSGLANTVANAASKAHQLTSGFDIHTWLAEQDNSPNVDAIRDQVIPLMNKYRGDNASSVFKLFADESNITTIRQMVSMLINLLDSTVNQDYIHDILAIYQFMHHQQDFRACLNTLENELQTYIKTSLPHLQLTTNSSGKFFIPCSDLDKTKCHKILSGYMYQWAGKNGFEYKAKLLDNLNSTTFCTLLNTKTIIKDSSQYLIAEHGMWSHSIQWWAVFHQHAKTGFLQHSPIELYKLLGNLNENFWNTVFDKGPVTREFTSPEYVTEAIRNEPDNLPILYATIKRQMYKIDNGYMISQFGYYNKLIKKHGSDFVTGFSKTALNKSSTV